MKIFNFLSTLFGNKDFISQESPILADFENTTFIFIDIFMTTFKSRLFYGRSSLFCLYAIFQLFENISKLLLIVLDN